MINLQIKYVVAPKNVGAFETMIGTVYAQALAKQKGYLGYRLLREYTEEERRRIDATSDGYNFILELIFETEELRIKWVESPEHDPAFEEAKKLANPITHNGYHVVQDTRVKQP